MPVTPSGTPDPITREDFLLSGSALFRLASTPTSIDTEKDYLSLVKHGGASKMKIIDRIEINYFRSVYNVSIKNLSDLNVFIGPNDAGKSNILRALNLFFNNESGYEEDLLFLQDVTHLRQQEAREAKGRLTIWVKIHFNNVEKWRTLPEKFFIKKTWNRYSDDPEVTSDVKNKQSLTRFQNKIKFHYVPAVKEKDIFSYYLNLMYETLS